MVKPAIPELQKSKIRSALNVGKRFDGRAPLDYRDIQVTKGVSNNAESCVSVRVGKTEVYCGVKLGVVEPYGDSPDEGTFMTSVELHPMASEGFDIGKPGIDAVELARVIDRGIRESGFIDFKGLSIESGKKVWQVFVDIVTINDDGNLFDVAGLAALVALGSAKLPVYNAEENKIEHKLSDTPLPLNKDALSFNMTFYKIGNAIVLDPTEEEEDIADFRLSVAFGDFEGKPRVTALQKGLVGVISEKDLNLIFDTVKEKYNTFFPKIKQLVWGE